jgi:hypothetical protein
VDARPQRPLIAQHLAKAREHLASTAPRSYKRT